MTLEILRVDHSRRYPPRVTAFTKRFWDDLSEGVFSTTRCHRCSRFSFPPKPICPHCWTEDIVWEPLGPDGTLYSWTRIHAGPAIFEADLPLAVGVVDLDVGVRLATPLHGDGVNWACGMRVRLLTQAYSDGPLFAAAPI